MTAWGDRLDTLGAASDAGRLLSFGLRPRLRPVKDSDYARLIVRFKTEPAFEQLVRATATGQGLTVLDVDRIEGIVLAANDDDSPYRIRLADYVNLPNSDVRLLHGFVHLAIAATAYPTAAALEDDQRLASVSVQQVYERIRRIVDDQKQAAGRTDPPEDDPELEPLWRLIGRLRAADTTPDGRDTPYNIVGAIRKALRWLDDNGLAEPVKGESDMWRLRDRYRLQVQAAAADTVDVIRRAGAKAS